jgi:antirestriction protein
MKNAEEVAVHGYSGFGDLFIDENESVEEIHEKARFIVEQGELGAELLAYYGGDLKYVQETLEKYYVGEYQSESDYADHLFDEIYLSDVPEDIQYCIDYEQFQRTIFINDYLSIEVGGSCHVFRRH